MPKRKARPVKSAAESQDFEAPVAIPNVNANPQAILTRKNITILVLVILIALAWKFKGLLIAATVNGQPISRMELNNELQKRFGSQVLDNIVNERLIMGAARQKGIFVTSSEIDNKTKEIESRLTGKMTLEEALKAQGLTRDDFRRQLEIQISIDKMFTSESTVSAKEIEEYISKNSQSFKNSTDPAQVRQQVNDMLHQQKLSEVFDKWFEGIKAGAKVQRFI